jgi:BirA family biotin operon repressor/biotin-[acetyl-CoA-carboxylase] ligase
MVHGLRRDHEPRLSLAMAVAVVKAIDELGCANPGIGIRWPNDIEVGSRKLGGILPELLDTSLGHRLLVGVGLNVLTHFDQAPEEIRRMATSLSLLQASPLGPDPLPKLLDGILRRFDQELRALAEDSPSQAEEWNRLNVLCGKMVRVNLGSRVITGRVEAIDAQGALLLVDQDTCQTHRLFGGQVLRNATASMVPGTPLAEA